MVGRLKVTATIKGGCLSVLISALSLVPQRSAGQEAALATLEEEPLGALAWEAGCLTSAECAALSGALLGNPLRAWTQQGVAALLAPDRRIRVLGCLIAIPEWRALFDAGMRMTVRQEETVALFRLDVRPGEGAEQCAARMGVRHFSTLGAAGGLEMALSQGTASLNSGHLSIPVRDRMLWVGRLQARYGQGLVMWTPSPFDDLGGIEGTHRIGRGIQAAWYPQRGVVQGVGWERTQRVGPTSARWSLMGWSWPDRQFSAATGGTYRKVGWAWRGHQLWSGAWSAVGGIHGKGQRKGWSWRWAVAAFEGGWEGRASVLRTWSRRWEGHAMVHRQDLDHPRWWSGEVRSTPPESAVPSAVDATCGMAFNGAWRGWARLSFRWSGDPPFRLRRSSAFRLERRGHRVAFKSEWRPEGTAEGTQSGPLDHVKWSLTWRAVGTLNATGLMTWRCHFGASGSEGTRGWALAVMLAWKSVKGGALRLGVGEAWGPSGAPVRYVQGWDGRPAGVFSGRASLAYFRWRSSNGQWRIGAQSRLSEGKDGPDPTATSWSIHAIRVEFRPTWPPQRKR